LQRVANQSIKILFNILSGKIYCNLLPMVH
jgi:hypothetical protein